MSSAQIISATAFHSKMALARGPGCPAGSGVSGTARSQRPAALSFWPLPFCRGPRNGHVQCQSSESSEAPRASGKEGPRTQGLRWYWNHLPAGLGRDTADRARGTKATPLADPPRGCTSLAQFTDGDNEVQGTEAAAELGPEGPCHSASCPRLPQALLSPQLQGRCPRANSCSNFKCLSLRPPPG